MIFWKKKEEFYPIGSDIPLQKKDSYRFLDSITVQALKMGRKRMFLIASLFAVAFFFVFLRLFYFSIIQYEPFRKNTNADDFAESTERADIVDRNGIILASSLPFRHLSVDSIKVREADEKGIVRSLIKLFPRLDKEDLIKKLSSQKRDIILLRNLGPSEQEAVNRLGYPQLFLPEATHRVYPQSSLFSHLLGYTDIDNRGIAGLEKKYDEQLRSSNRDLVLTVDARIQEIVRTILSSAVEKFSADGGVAIVMNTNTAEVLAMVSLPDFDPNQISTDKISMNKASVGMYELGSVMKPFSVAFGLESKKIKKDSKIEAYNPFVLAKGRKITDFQAENRVLSVPEVLIYSSNIGTAKIAQMIGPEEQKNFLNKFHFLTVLPIDLPEKGRPLVQEKWDLVETATIGYGYGIGVSPLHLVAGFSALVNGGGYHIPRFVKSDQIVEEQVLSKETSFLMRQMLRAVVEIGSGKKANIKGFNVIGKTGTAQMQDPNTGKYLEGKVRTSFIGAFPFEKPLYTVYVMIENPQKRKEDYYFNTAGWNACPTGGQIIEAIAPILGVEPQNETKVPSYMKGAYDYYEKKKKR